MELLSWLFHSVEAITKSIDTIATCSEQMVQRRAVREKVHRHAEFCDNAMKGVVFAAAHCLEYQVN